MKLNRSRLNWGVFFIVLGAVPLAYHQGSVSLSTLADAWRLWPLVLVGIGLGLVLSRTPAYFVGGLVVAACLGLVLGSLFAVGPQLGCGHPSGAASTISRDGGFEGAGHVELDLQCGRANVTTSPDSQWHVRASNTGRNDPDVISSAGSLVVRSGNRDDWWVDRGDENWDVALPSAQSIGLTVSIDAGDAHLNLGGANLSSANFSLNAGSLHADLTGARVGSLTVSTNVGASSLILDGNSTVSGTISTNVGSLELCAPSQLGLRLESNESLASSNFASAGLVRVGNAWQTPGYETAASKANFTVSTSVGSLTLNPAGGCK
ncbi:MAG: hypothetical protein ABSD62_02680 [Candidatus Limnocylindrales bacterium]|jgi:hypothetical protein